MLNPEIVAQLQEIHIGGLTFYGYGFIMALSVAIPYLLFRKVNRDPKISDFISAELLACMIVGGIVIGRLVFVVSEIDYFILNPQDILKTWEGGITIFGVVPGAVLGFLIFKKISKTTLNTWKFLDALVPFTALLNR